MLIILEGPDGVGKTTLAEKLRSLILKVDPRSTVCVLRKGPPTSHPLDEYLTPLLNYRPNQGLHLILDRWHIGEWVYPRLSYRNSQLDNAVYWYLNQWIRRLGGLLVYCHTDAARAEQIYRERSSTHYFEQPGVYEKAELLFTQALNLAELPQVTYDWDDPEVVDPANIVRTAQTRDDYMTHLNDFVTYVGRRRPEYLLVGEVRHGLDVQAQQSFSTDPRPAFMPYRATSGHWLISSLLTSERLRQSAGLANACDVDDVHALWYLLDKPKVVALGRSAAKELGRIGDIPFGITPHPQFGRRFHYRDQASYADTIFRALENQEDHSKWRGSLKDATAVTSTARSLRPLGASVDGKTPATE